MNEATLEARLNAELRRLFPVLTPLQLTHQETFTVTLGRNSLAIDSTEQFKLTGRLDVLVRISDRPLAIFELKNPGQAISDADRDQGISYARLLTPMPPLVIITNGSESQFYTSHDGEVWLPKDRNEETIQALFKHASALAASERDDAVKLFLGHNPQAWKSVLSRQTATALADCRGEVWDLTRSLAVDFAIKRSITRKILEALAAKSPLVVVTGFPVSGKTNVLAQICDEGPGNGLVPFFVEAGSAPHGIFRHLATVFCQNLFFAATQDETRQWLIHGLRLPVDGRLVIVIDGWSPLTHDQNFADLSELASLADSNTFSILLGVDSNTWDVLCKEPGRTTETLLGRKAVVFRLTPLTDEEFSAALDLLLEKFNTTFFHGAFHNLEYRESRVLRIAAGMTAQISTSKGRHQRKPKRRRVSRLAAVSGIALLSAMRTFLASPDVRSDLMHLARAFIEDAPQRRPDPSWQIFAYGQGAVILETAERVLGSGRLDRLREQGFVSLAHGPSGRTFVLPKVPEILAAAASLEIASAARGLWPSDQGRAYEMVIRDSEAFPLGDIVGAAAILELEDQSTNALTAFIDRLQADQPKMTPVRKGAELIMYFPDVGEKEIRIQDDLGADEQTQANTHPWLVLSHLAALPILDANGSLGPLLVILAKVGSHPDVLWRPGVVPVRRMTPLCVHAIEGRGKVLCGREGIVEPIGQAMVNGFHTFPKEMLILVREAVKGDEFNLGVRLSAAASESASSTMKPVSSAAKMAGAILRRYLRDSFRKFLGKTTLHP